MGLLVKLLGANWQCVNCGRKYRNEPTVCDCGDSVYRPVD